MNARTHRSVRTTIWATAVCLATACSAVGIGGDKAGGDTVVLRLATIDGVPSAGETASAPETFAEALSEVSGGRLKVDLLHTYGDGRPDAESDLVKALAKGSDLDGGWPATRAFAAAGIEGWGRSRHRWSSPATRPRRSWWTDRRAGQVLAALDGTGVKGLSLGLGPLRRPFAGTAPLVGPEDWSGAVFRVFNSPVQAATVTALGGRPENASFTWLDKVKEGSIRGAEFDVNSTLGGGAARHEQRGALAQGVRVQPEPEAVRLAHDAAARMGGPRGEARDRRHDGRLLRQPCCRGSAVSAGNDVLGREQRTGRRPSLPRQGRRRRTCC